MVYYKINIHSCQYFILGQLPFFDEMTDRAHSEAKEYKVLLPESRFLSSEDFIHPNELGNLDSADLFPSM